MADDLADRYAVRLPLLETLATALEDEAKAALREVAHIDRVSFRVKDPLHFAAKASKANENEPRYHDPLREVEDQVAGRVLVFFKRDIATVEAALLATFRAQELGTREPVSPKEFDYESRHQVFLVPTHLAPAEWVDRNDLPIAFEMQVRTLFMHAWAEPQHDLGYKAEAPLPREARRLIASAAASAWGADHAFEELLSMLAATDMAI